MYDCKRCGSSFDQKSTLKTHFNKKNTCKPILSDIPVDTLLKELSTLGKTIPDVTYSCTKCGKEFSHKSNMYAHRKKCTVQNEKSLLEEIQNLRDEVAQLRQTILVAAPAPASIATTITDSVINVNIQQSVTLNPYNNCKFNIFGNLDSIDPEMFYSKLKDDPLDGIGAFLYCRFFNPNHPENHVLAASQKKLDNNEMYVWDNGWKCRSKHEISQQIHYEATNYIDAVFTKYDPNQYTHIISLERSNEMFEKNNDRFRHDPTKNELKEIPIYIKNHSPVDPSKITIQTGR